MPKQFTETLSSRDIHAMLVKGLDAPAASWFTDLANRVDSDKEYEKYVWLGSAPTMKPWIGGRTFGTLEQHEFVVRNKKFESGLRIPLDWIRRDSTGQVMMKVAELTERATDHKINLLSQLMDIADATPCYDGQYFFDTDHEEGDSGVQSNIVTVSGVTTPTAPTPAQMEDAILRTIERMYSFKDDRGEVTNGSAKRFLVMVPLGLMRPLATALGAELMLEGGQTRTNNMRTVGTLMGVSIEGQVNPRSTWTDQFAVYRADAAIKPYVWQVERDLKVSSIAEDSEHEMLHDEWLFGVDTSYNVGLNQWRGAAKTKFTT